jgi:putative serine/threonine protein kinase
VDELLHTLKTIDKFVKLVLCYPKTDCGELLDRRIKALSSLGITGIYEEGRREIEGYKILGKGFTSIVVLGMHRYYGKVAVKIRRIDSRRNSLEYEGMILDYLSPTLIPPYPYFYMRDFIIMEPICGQQLIHILSNSDRMQRLHILRSVFSALYLIDLFGIDHGELNRPVHHMFYCDGLPRIIDWDSASLSEKPHNLTMFASYLFFRGGRRLLDNKELNEKPILTALKTYKSKLSLGFRMILRLLGQS